MPWDSFIVRETAEQRVAVIIGSGVSAGSTNQAGAKPPTWDGLLLALMENCTAADKAAAQVHMDNKRYLDAAQIIVDGIATGEFDTAIKQLLEGPDTDPFRPSVLHELIQQLDPSVVVSLNYDRLYEAQWNSLLGGTNLSAYQVCKYYEDHVPNLLRSPSKAILKIHGCLSNSQRVVLSRGQYFTARQENQGFYNLIDAILLTHTLLFVGCGIGIDPDVSLLLENAVISQSGAHHHYALVPAGRHPSDVRSIDNTFNIRLLEYEGGHGEAITALQDLVEKVAEYRAARSGGSSPAAV